MSEAGSTDEVDGAGTGQEEEGVTMLEVLEDSQALEEDAAAVLGSVSDTACTFPLGYLPRQPLYACTDCSEAGPPAGVCLGKQTVVWFILCLCLDP